MTPFQLFHITCKGLIFYKDSFLLHLANDPDFYGALECPGGRVNQNELIENALKRELIEEIGLDLDKTKHTLELFALNQRDAAEYDWDKKTHIIEVYYKIVIPDEETFELKALEEVSRFEWIHKEINLSAYRYKVATRKAIYEKAQHSLKKPTSLR